jgi:hypothetical protein
MSVLRTIVPPLGLLTATGVALVAVLNMPVGRVEPPRQASPRVVEGALSSVTVRSEEDALAAVPDIAPDIWNRPLFAEGRRPPMTIETEPVPVETAPVQEIAQPLEAPVEQAVVPALPDIRMLGSMSRDGKMRALVLFAASGDELWVDVGYSFDGWMLTKISQSDIQLMYEATEVTIQLFE